MLSIIFTWIVTTFSEIWSSFSFFSCTITRCPLHASSKSEARREAAIRTDISIWQGTHLWIIIQFQKKGQNNTSFDNNVEIRTFGKWVDLYTTLVKNQNLVVLSWQDYRYLHDIFRVTKFLQNTHWNITYYLSISPVQPCLVVHLFQFLKACTIKIK